ncbi:MAG: glycosyltransferase family 2 protein [Muribaculaceae bacterium]|nr:glycosyltransferase family 2 protein [Muribaculaceae bacterium]
MSLPKTEGVDYIVVWQMPGMTDRATPPDSVMRDDIRIIVSDTAGLSQSRNIAIGEATGEVCLIADDDTVLISSEFQTIKKIFSETPDIDIALFRIAGKQKKYPEKRITVNRKLPKGYWVTSPEIAFRTASIRGKLKFRNNFGLGAPRFTAAEESFFITDAIRQKLKIEMIPVETCIQPSPSSGERAYSADGGFPASQGAFIRYTHGIIHGFPRIIMFATRASLTAKAPFLFTLKHAFKGFTCRTTEML